MQSDPYDEDLLQKAIRGDETAFISLYDQWVEKVFLFCHLQGVDQQSAEDVTLDVFRNAWAGIEKYDPASVPFNVWLFSIARVVLTRWAVGSARKRGSGFANVADLPAGVGLSLASLPAIPREVVILRLVLGFDTQQICLTLNITQDEFRSANRQALAHLNGNGQLAE